MNKEFYSPQEVYENKMLITNPSLWTVYNMLADKRLTALDNGTPKRAQWHIRQQDIDTFNDNVRNGRMPQPETKVVKQIRTR